MQSIPVLTNEHVAPSLSPSDSQLGERSFHLVYLGYEQRLDAVETPANGSPDPQQLQRGTGKIA